MRITISSCLGAGLAAALAGCGGGSEAGPTPGDPGVLGGPADGSEVVVGPDGTPVPADGSPDLAGGGPTLGNGAPTGVSDVPATDPGRVTVHRLNRAEYNNTVRDLLGTQLTPADEFPIDDRGSGFDNIADVLTVSPLHLNTYNAATETLVAEVLTNPAQRSQLIPCDLAAEGSACAQSVLETFTPRAWRRPVTPDEMARLLGLVQLAVDQGDDIEVGLSLALRAILISPHFIFRVELDPDPTSLTPHPLNAYEVASRLSYFLWSSMPDDELFAMAGSGALLDSAQLSTQVTRMLGDGKASALVDNFAGQWLALRAVADVAPNSAVFPDFDEELRAAMRGESEALFREVVLNGLPLDQLLTADFTFLNDRLATHYGLPQPGSDDFVRVQLDPAAGRQGFLGHASILTVQSHPQRTSPVRRGLWVLNELLCTVIPAPPADVDLGSIDSAPAEGLSQRQLLEQHRANPVCATCHNLMDPIGLGLENYDGIGAFRTIDNGVPVDSAGQLPTGEPFSGAPQLATAIAARPEFARCAAERLYTYALGRGPDRTPGHLDVPTLASLADQLVSSGYNFTTLVNALVQSPTFLSRRGEAGGASL